jgi:hypothetical protein
MKRIEVDVPTSEARRERVEREVFARLAATRIADRVDAVFAAKPRWRMRAMVACAGLAVAAAIALVVFRHEPTPMASETASRIVTPVGGSSRFMVADAVIDAGSDTSVEVQRTADGGVTLVLARGSVDCDVEPRHGRPPFRVVAGDVIVEVVGTRFTVARTSAVRVDVSRGKVRVTSAERTDYVMPGESWPSTVQTAQAAQPSQPTSHEEPAVPTAPAADVQAPPTSTHRAPRPSEADAQYAAAQKLEASDPARAARTYRALANGNDRWAAVALYSLAELHANRDPATALRELDELLRRFPKAANAEDAAWLRVDVVSATGTDDDVRAAANDYLRRFPTGTYVKNAARLASP